MSDYMARLLAAQAAGVFHIGDIAMVDIEHGPGCTHGHHRSHPCTCTPRITALIGTDLLTIGSDGRILEKRRKS